MPDHHRLGQVTVTRRRCLEQPIVLANELLMRGDAGVRVRDANNVAGRGNT